MRKLVYNTIDEFVEVICFPTEKYGFSVFLIELECKSWVFFLSRAFYFSRLLWLEYISLANNPNSLYINRSVLPA